MTFDADRSRTDRFGFLSAHFPDSEFKVWREGAVTKRDWEGWGD